MDEETLLKKINDLTNKNLFQEALDLLLSQEKIVKKKYYDFLKVKIFLFQKTNNLFEAKRLIINELELPYIPLDIEKYLRSSLSEINAIINFESAKINSLDVSELINASEEVIISNLENLKNINLRNYLLEIQFILNRKDLSNLLKFKLLPACAVKFPIAIPYFESFFIFLRSGTFSLIFSLHLYLQFIAGLFSNINGVRYNNNSLWFPLYFSEINFENFSPTCFLSIDIKYPDKSIFKKKQSFFP